MKPGFTAATSFFLVFVFFSIAPIGIARSDGRIIVLRAANFGWNLSLHLQIDGRAVANVVQGRRYDHFVPAGRHLLTVSAVPTVYFS